MCGWIRRRTMQTKHKALVTGGSRGIGQAICRCLEEAGYEVHAPGRMELDLSSPQSVEAFIQANQDAGYDVLINNAGINEIALAENIAEEDLLRTMEVNLLGPIRLLRGLIPGMKEKGWGRIVNIGSIWGIVAKEGRLSYSATKHGIHGVTATLALELAPYGILVNTLCPGLVRTALTEKNNTPEQIRELSKMIPVGTLAEPDDIAQVARFLVSSENRYITGQQIVADGGYSVR